MCLNVSFQASLSISDSCVPLVFPKQIITICYMYLISMGLFTVDKDNGKIFIRMIQNVTVAVREAQLIAVLFAVFY